MLYSLNIISPLIQAQKYLLRKGFIWLSVVAHDYAQIRQVRPSLCNKNTTATLGSYYIIYIASWPQTCIFGNCFSYLNMQWSVLSTARPKSQKFRSHFQKCQKSEN